MAKKFKKLAKDKLDTNTLTRCEVKVNGIVQGVGFRPFIYRLAHNFN
ncbi:MAG: acylphosphatase, partial [Melioribacteraceae bacterium]|nr:acylphosphatase [Melioribacteraceae bacterium]